MDKRGRSHLFLVSGLEARPVASPDYRMACCPKETRLRAPASPKGPEGEGMPIKRRHQDGLTSTPSAQASAPLTSLYYADFHCY